MACWAHVSLAPKVHKDSITSAPIMYWYSWKWKWKGSAVLQFTFSILISCFSTSSQFSFNCVLSCSRSLSWLHRPILVSMLSINQVKAMSDQISAFKHKNSTSEWTLFEVFQMVSSSFPKIYSSQLYIVVPTSQSLSDLKDGETRLFCFRLLTICSSRSSWRQ
jgi:hypothetical protein